MKLCGHRRDDQCHTFANVTNGGNHSHENVTGRQSQNFNESVNLLAEPHQKWEGFDKPVLVDLAGNH